MGPPVMFAACKLCVPCCAAALLQEGCANSGCLCLVPISVPEPAVEHSLLDTAGQSEHILPGPPDPFTGLLGHGCHFAGHMRAEYKLRGPQTKAKSKQAGQGSIAGGGGRRGARDGSVNEDAKSVQKTRHCPSYSTQHKLRLVLFVPRGHLP
eukprot:365114-Chlamydomonas_euryale.AAC.7